MKPTVLLCPCPDCHHPAIPLGVAVSPDMKIHIQAYCLACVTPFSRNYDLTEILFEQEEKEAA